MADNTDITLQDNTDTTLQSEPHPRPWPRFWWAWVLFIVLAIAAAVASRFDLNYYAVQPGIAQPVQQFITVPASKGHPVSNSVLLTDVEIGRVSALSYLWYKLQSNTTLDPLISVTGGTPPSELNAQGVLEMAQAEADAKTSALRRLGYQVPSRRAGAVVFATFPGSPAWGVLNVGDVIVGVDGAPVATAIDLGTMVRHFHSGQTITMMVKRGGTGAPQAVPITLRSTVVNLGGGQKQTETLGVYAEDQVDYTYPFPFRINVANIGGPSAGLAMTLGVIDELTGGSITGHQKVAATGTIDGHGNVGDVGGVPQKTIAVEEAGASIFLVPPAEYKAALSKATPGLHVYAVSTLDQALAVLAAHGGTMPGLSSTSTPTSTPTSVRKG